KAACAWACGPATATKNPNAKNSSTTSSKPPARRNGVRRLSLRCRSWELKSGRNSKKKPRIARIETNRSQKIIRKIGGFKKNPVQARALQRNAFGVGLTGHELIRLPGLGYD